jgi:hypothetical protein
MSLRRSKRLFKIRLLERRSSKVRKIMKIM